MIQAIDYREPFKHGKAEFIVNVPRKERMLTLSKNKMASKKWRRRKMRRSGSSRDCQASAREHGAVRARQVGIGEYPRKDQLVTTCTASR